MPDARLAPEGSWRTGFSRLKPYSAIWSSVTVFPWIEGSFRYTEVSGVPGFPDPGRRQTFGDFKDKSFDAKVLVLPERGAWPAVAVGMQDAAGGTGVFRALFAAASKRVGPLDLTLGYGRQRIDGAFGGVRWTPDGSDVSFVAEYDANDYRRDPGAALSGAARYRKQVSAGLEYRHGWLGAKAFAAHGQVGFNAYVSVPLEDREFVAKVDEPPPYTRINPRPTQAQWSAEPEHRRRLARALVEQDFREVALGYEQGRLSATLTNVRISSLPRAVGRAARTLLSFAPLETRELRITYLQGTLPIATYTFINVPLLQRYFNGMASREQLAAYVAVEYARPGETADGEEAREALRAFSEPLPEGIVVGRHGADLVTLRGENVAGGLLQVRPAISTYLNDPSGALKYDISAIGSYHRPLGGRTFLQAETKFTVFETVSEVTQPSNSTLPHVRSDVAEYKRGSRLKLLRLLANRFYQPGERIYARASAGIYEEMFSGAGGQVLYLPRDGRWAVDFSADWVRQRDFDGWLGHRDYHVLTAIASLNYRMAKGLTGTLRAGRFLARDEGVRAELKRRFASGFEVGAWYTVTNGRDITSPGTPSSPYRDKGLFMLMPLDTMLTRDTQSAGGFALAPWTRDVGQMVASPGDLFGILERPVLQMHEHDGLVRFGDRDDDYALPRLGVPAGREWPDMLALDFASARKEAQGIDWLQSAAIGVGLTLSAAALDDRALRFAERHRNARWMKSAVRLGDVLPVAAMGASALFAFDDSRSRLSEAGIAALEAGSLAFVASTGLKYALGRARPTTGLGRREFEPGSSSDRFHAFPSRHSTVMWAAVTPYAQEFGMPWLYGIAALASAARVGSRDHWLSDAVGGAAIGYALGHLAWKARSESSRDKRGPRLALRPRSVALEWDLP